MHNRFNLPTAHRENRSLAVRIILAALVIAAIGTFLTYQSTLASPPEQEANPVTLTLFWGEGCPHCAAAKPVLIEMASRYPNLELRFYEIYNIPENRTLWERMGAAYNVELRGVPSIFISDQYFEGWSDELSALVESYVAKCSTEACTDLGAGVIGVNEGILTEIDIPTAEPEPEPTPTLDVNSDEINIPLIGKVDLSKQSLVVSTA